MNDSAEHELIGVLSGADDGLSSMNQGLLIPTFHQVPWSNLISRVDSGSQALFELQTLLQDRKENDERQLVHYMKMSKANLFQHEIETSTSERMLGFFKNYHLFVHKALINQHKEFIDVILKDLETLKVDRATIINKHKVSIQTCLRDIANAQEGLEKAKKNYVKTKADFLRSIERLTQAEKAVEENIRLTEERKKDMSSKESNKWSRMFSAFESTPEQERDKQQKKVEKRRDELSIAADAIIERRQLLLNMLARYDEEIQLATEAFQQLEVERMKHVQIFMKQFCRLEKQSLEIRQQQLLIYEEAVILQQPEEDIALFITQARQPELTHKFGSALALLEEFNSVRIDDSVLDNNMTDADNDTDPMDGIDSELRPSLLEKHDKKDLIAANDKTEDILNESVPNDSNIVSTVEIAVSPTVDGEESNDAGIETNRETSEFVVDPNLDKLNHWLHDIFNKSCRQISKSDISEGVGIISMSMLERIEFPSEIHEAEEWKELLGGKSIRSRFMQELDHQRGKHALLDDSRFQTLSNATVAFLDVCEGSDDMMVAVSAMRVANMANTFHKEMDNEEVNQKIYLQSDPRFLEHSIWKKQGFWEMALKESVFSQLHNHLPVTRWDEMNMEQLREVVQGIHNILFGQLGSLSFAMLQQGLSQSEVLERVIRMSRKFELSEDQEFELVVNIAGKRIKEYVPPPILAVPNLPPPPSGSSNPEAKVFAVPTGQIQKKPSVFSRARKSMNDATKLPTSNQPNAVSTSIVISSTISEPSSPLPSISVTPSNTVEQKKPKMSFLSSMTRSSSSNSHNNNTSLSLVATPGKSTMAPVGQSPSVQLQKANLNGHNQRGNNEFDDDFFAVL